MMAERYLTTCDHCGGVATAYADLENGPRAGDADRAHYCDDCDEALSYDPSAPCLCGAPLELDGTCSVPECVVRGADAWMDHLEANADANCTTEAGACWS